jgi:DNA-directed RNA polymerase subunit M/transcription elongation factor TFIIS
MNHKNIRLSIESDMKRLLLELEELRKTCPHQEVLREHKRSGGNDESWWVSCTCDGCGKYWKE